MLSSNRSSVFSLLKGTDLALYVSMHLRMQWLEMGILRSANIGTLEDCTISVFKLCAFEKYNFPLH